MPGSLGHGVGLDDPSAGYAAVDDREALEVMVTPTAHITAAAARDTTLRLDPR